jgi:flagellar biosynthesis/type III secretory pathway protein FliH
MERGVNDANEEEGSQMGAEAPQRDGKVSELRTHAVDLHRVRCLKRTGLQNSGSLFDEAYDAGEREGYAQGYVDGYDAGEEVTTCRIMKSIVHLNEALTDLERKVQEIERGEL